MEAVSIWSIVEVTGREAKVPSYITASHPVLIANCVARFLCEERAMSVSYPAVMTIAVIKGDRGY